MGWQPQARWDGRRFRVQINERVYSLGTDYAEAMRRCADLLQRLTGRGPKQPPIAFVEVLVGRWLGEHPGAWAEDMLKPWCRFARNTRLADITEDHLIEFGVWCRRQKRRQFKGGKRGTVTTRRPWSPETVKHYVQYASRVLRWAREKGLIKIMPRRPRLEPTGYQPQDLSPQELAGVLQRMDASPKRRHAGRLVRFIVSVGCRPGEACGLRWDQVRLSQRVCILAQHKTRRLTGATRSIVLSDDAIAILTDIQGRRTSPRGPVFLSSRGTPYTTAGLRSICRRLGFYPYRLRHTFGQSHTDEGADLATVAAAMGHKHLSTTQRYAQVRHGRVLTMLQDQASPLQRATRVGPPAHPRKSKTASVSRRRGSPPKKRKSDKARGRLTG